MKQTITLFICFAAFSAFSQDKSLLINSGEIIKEGISYYEDGKYDKAINKFKLVNESDTNYATALYELGLAYSSQKSYPSAIETFKKGVALQSSVKADFIQQLGNAYSGNKQFEMAIATYRSGLRELPYYFRFYYEMAAACYEDKRPREAMKYLDTCLKINFSYGRAHYLMGMICKENNYFVPAIMSYQMAAYFSFDNNIGLSSLISIQDIAKGAVTIDKDSIVTLFEPGENEFEELEEIIRSKSELDSRYKVKPSVKLKYTDLIKCLHLVNSRINQHSGVKGWYGENLVPVYIAWWNHKDFAPMLYRMCVATKDEDALKAFTKNKSAIMEQYSNFYVTILEGRHTYESRLPGVTGTFKHQFIHNNSNLYGMIPVTETYTVGKGYMPQNGQYIYFYRNGNLKSRINYKDGEEQGTSTHYYEEGGIKEIAEIISQTEYKYTYFYSNGQPEYSGVIKDSKRSEQLISYHSNGVINKIIPLNTDNELHGKLHEYFDNGQLYRTLEYNKGKLKDGEVISYYKTGIMQDRILYKNEELDGPYTEYYLDGEVKISGQYKDGKRDGAWKQYHRNGKLAEEYSYKAGNLDGSYKTYYDDGVLESESTYADGDNKGKTLRYDYDGKVFAEYEESKGKIKHVIYYDKTGKAIYEADARKNELQLLKYNALGIKTEEGTVLKDFRTGTWKFYENNGSLSYTRVFDSKGDANGKCEEYFVGGAIKAKYELKDNNYNGYYVSYYSNGNKYLEGYYVDGSRDGLWKEYHPNGNISEESYYINDDLKGVYKTYYPNGKISTAQEYKDGRFYKYTLYDTEGNAVMTDTITMASRAPLTVSYKNGSPYLEYSYNRGSKDGRQVSYWGNKNIKDVMEYRNGYMEGFRHMYYPGGKLQWTNYYRFGERDSTYTSYYENGSMEMVKMYRKDEANGPEKYYYENGKLEMQGENRNDVREGWFEYYSPDGHLQYKMLYHLGIEIAYSYQDKSGSFVKDVPFANASGEFNCTFSNGNPSAKGSMVNGERHGTYVKYYFNGKKAFEATYSYGFKEGVCTEYYENGKVKSEVNYIMDRKDGIEKEYDEQGNLKKETSWSHDYKNGPETVYKNGKVVKTIQYEYDNTYDK